MAFWTVYKHFEYQKMFFELVNAFVTFQAYINKILFELIDIICVVSLNNLLIYFKNRNSYVKHVKQVLNHFKKIWFICQIKSMRVFQKFRLIFWFYYKKSRYFNEFSSNKNHKKLIKIEIIQKHANIFWNLSIFIKNLFINIHT